MIDKKGRIVNQRGYLIDKYGNVIDTRGKLMFDKIVLDNDGDIPIVFRNGLLSTDSGSDISRVLSNQDDKRPLKENDGETSMDSQMGDTPANYNDQNQRYHDEQEPIDEEGDDDADHLGNDEYGDENEDEQHDPEVAKKKIKKKKKAKKPKLSTIEFLQPTGREKDMAGAYGGQAVGQIRRPGIKYDDKRLEGSRKFRVSTAEEQKVRA